MVWLSHLCRSPRDGTNEVVVTELVAYGIISGLTVKFSILDEVSHVQAKLLTASYVDGKYVYQLTYLDDLPAGKYDVEVIVDSVEMGVMSLNWDGAQEVGPGSAVGGGPSAAEVAQTVWAAQASGNHASGSFGELVAQTNTSVDLIASDVATVIDAGVSSILVSQAAAQSLIETLLKYQRNRTRIDKNAKQMIIYDDDTLTPIKIFDLKDSNGDPSITEIIERMPV